jgi:ABC-type nickel/cobalt efflux system permease component RcnA
MAGTGPAGAHPLGNFTVSAYSGLRVGPDRLEVDHVVDMAEIPAFQTRQAIDADHDGTVAAAEAAAWRDRECPRLAAGLRATVDGQPLALAVTGSSLTFPPGAGGLATLRLECALRAPLPAAENASRSLAFTDGNQPGRVGWREITAIGDRATLESADVPPASPSARLATYPKDQLSSPLGQRTASLRFHPGGPPAPQAPAAQAPAAGPDPADPPAPVAGGPARGNPTSGCEAPRRGKIAEPGSGCSGLSTPPGGVGAPGPTGANDPGRAEAGGPVPVARGGVDRLTAAFTGLVGERSLSPGFAVVALVLAVGLGAGHALAPGHGKTVMAAYLVGLRGTAGQAVTIGATVTLTHTAGVLLLGLVLTTTGAVASERVYPWLGLVSGLLLAAVGIGLLARARTGRHPHHHDHTHPHGDHHADPHGNRHADPHGTHHADPHGNHHPPPHGTNHVHPHENRHAHPHGDHHDGDHHAHGMLSRRGLVALGLAGGLVPSPSAVVVLLGGIALGRAWFGVALVLAYGLGMAATLTGIGLLLARLRDRVDRRLQLPAGSLLARAAGLLPAATASVIVLVGLALAASGAAQL